MPGKALPTKIVAVAAAVALVLTSAVAAQAAVVPAPLSPFAVSAAVLPGGSSLPAGTYAFVRGTDGHIHMRSIAPNAPWIDTRIPAGAATGPMVVFTSQPPPPSAPRPFGRSRTSTAPVPKLDVSILTTDLAGRAMTTVNDNDDLNAWESWYVLGGTYTSPLGVNYDKHFSTPTNQVVFYAARGADGKLYTNGTDFKALITSAPALSYNAVYQNTILTFRGMDGNLYRMVNGVNGDSHYFGAPVRLGTAQVASAASVGERSPAVLLSRHRQRSLLPQRGLAEHPALPRRRRDHVDPVRLGRRRPESAGPRQRVRPRRRRPSLRLQHRQQSLDRPRRHRRLVPGLS
ncbi:hypothetical protein [Fodinicola feengrottensis]|uniref:hypothetical protein n=1 Tax=Fodinicola feengrottensis TaxID=435914 RepID=UPI0013D17CB1|nr:hypothetical protein [Fodinicola feengrottensis]